MFGSSRLSRPSNFEKLPGGVFRRSFVLQYARALGVDEDEIAGELAQLNQFDDVPATPAPPIALAGEDRTGLGFPLRSRPERCGRIDAWLANRGSGRDVGLCFDLLLVADSSRKSAYRESCDRFVASAEARQRPRRPTLRPPACRPRPTAVPAAAAVPADAAP